MTNEDYQKLLPNLPNDPGVYKYIDSREAILYVGKAKNLKKRIGSYFGQKKHMAYKTRTMVKLAKRIDFIIVKTEQDALLLENTLIKKNQPPFNVMLKDGKSYTYICIKNERFPRVFFTRRLFRDGSIYFGPYTSKYRARIVLDTIKNIFPIRTCPLLLTEKNIQAGKFKVCLEYHIKNCYGPCVSYESEEKYNDRMAQIKNLLKGNFGEVKRHLKGQMSEYSMNMEFEKAQALKEKLEAFEDYQSSSTIVNTKITDVDVFAIGESKDDAYVNYARVINGAVILSYTVEFTKNLDDDQLDILRYAIHYLREKHDSSSKEIIVPFEVELPEDDIKVTVPQRGDKKGLLDFAQKNVDFYRLKKKKEKIARINKTTSAERILNTLKADLHMKELPMHIECFDNSNIQGTHPVASCVVFKNAKPSKKDYRKFNIKTVVGADDFASMAEVVHRRYRRLLDEDSPLPQLIIIDGGKGQLSFAVKSLKKLGILDKITIVGVAKKLEEIYFPNDSVPLYINKKSESLKLIQQARNEAHRFAINFHRDKRSQFFTRSGLEDIPGIGEKTSAKLIRHFRSVKKMQDAGLNEISRVVGFSIARKLMQFYGSLEEE